MSHCITNSRPSVTEADVLRSLQNGVTVDLDILKPLVARGFVAKVKAPKPYYLVTPEGLAALLDTVPIEMLTR